MRTLFPLLLVICIQLATALNFLAIGDWGGKDDEPYYKSAQLAAAQGMNKIAGELNAEFIMAVGDNFYLSGVTSETSPRFQSTFENVYSGEHLQKDWFVVAGNHDYRANVSAQIAYTNRSPRWKFPSTFYKKSYKTEDGGSVDFIYIDTVQLSSFNNVPEGHPDYFKPLPLRSKRDASEHWDWIEEQLKSSTADHIFVIGHYPVYSVCEHGPTQTLVQHMRPLLMQYQAHYIAGHDHCMEYLREPEANVHYFLTGMGDECCYKPIRKFSVPDDVLQWYIASDNQGSATAGFTGFQVNKAALVGTFYDQDGQLLYTTPKIPARKL